MTRYFVVLILLLGHPDFSYPVAAQNQLSLLIFTDSVIAYNGTARDGISLTKTAFEKNQLLDLLEKNKSRYGNDLQVLLKVDGAVGIMENVENIMEWLELKNIKKISITDPEPYDTKTFGIVGVPWALLNEPSDLTLNLPKEEPGPKIDIDDNTYFLIVVKDSAYAYNGFDLKSFSRYSIKSGSLHKYIALLADTTDPEKLLVVIKPTENSDYESILNVLDEMTINSIKKYTLMRLTPEEQSFFQLESKRIEGVPETIVSADPVVEETTPLEDSKPYLLFVLKINGYLSYQYADLKKTGKETQINPLTTENIFNILNQIEHENAEDLHKIKIFVKADGNVKFNDFDVLIGALKQKEIYKYNLISEK